VKEKKSSILSYWPFWRGILVAVGVIAIFTLAGKLLEFAANKALEAMFPERVVEVPLSYVNQEVGADVSSGVVLENWDDHGGFLGDGETLVRLQFSLEDGASVEQALQAVPGYIRGPFTASVAERLDFWSDQTFPTGEQIIWKLKDRNPDSGDHSINITLILYDPLTQILYYYETDT